MERIEDTWLIVPLYNEAEVIGDVISHARSVFSNVVCVDDGSRDSSAREAERAGAIVIRHPINLGQGAALQTGFEYFLTRTDGAYLATFDADGQHQIEDVAAMRERAIRDDLAIVLGSRFLDGSTQEMSAFRKLVLRAATLFTRLSTGVSFTDAHNGLRLLRRDAVSTLDLKHNRMAHASEIVDQLMASGLPWSEAPVHIKYTEYSRAKGQSALNSVNILVELLLG